MPEKFLLKADNMIDRDLVVFQVVFSSVSQVTGDIWESLVSFLSVNRVLPGKFEVSQIAGHSQKFHSTARLNLEVREIADLIKIRGLSGFSVDSERGLSYDFFRLGESGGAILGCRISQDIVSLSDWGLLIEQLMMAHPSMGGWQWRPVYSTWQNAHKLHRFHEKSYGEVPPGVIKYSVNGVDGLDPQFTFIDTSKFPGRFKQILPGVKFYPAAEMWLGPDFWQYAKCTKEEVLAADFFLEKRDTPHFLYLKSWQEPFTRPDGEQGRQQQRLWKLFFHEDCEWPPGSGRICDEPMYGPPELMPGYKAEQE